MAAKRLPKITAENYYSPKINMAYMSASQFKDFQSCEARALATVKGEYVRETTTALLVGSFIDAYFEGEKAFNKFKTEHPEIYNSRKPGELKADFKEAEKIITVIEADPLMMKYLSGEKQVIVTGKIEGVPIKGKLDSFFPGKAIVDGKIMKDFEPIYVPDLGKVNFVRAWGYDIQGAFYRAAVQQKYGTLLPFFIDAATKQDEPDKAVIRVPDGLLDSALELVKSRIVHYDEVKRGIVPAQRCEKCAYCRATKKLDRVQTLDEFDPEI